MPPSLAAKGLRRRHDALRVLMVAALDAANTCARSTTRYCALLAALRADAHWESQYLHPLLEAEGPGSSLPLASAVASLTLAAESIELDLRACRGAARRGQPAAWQRVARRVARLVGQLLLHLDAREQFHLGALTRRAQYAASPTLRPMETDR